MSPYAYVDAMEWGQKETLRKDKIQLEVLVIYPWIHNNNNLDQDYCNY